MSEVKLTKFTVLILPRKDGKNIFPEETLQEMAKTAEGKPFKKTLNGPAIGKITRAWVAKEGVKVEVTCEGVS